jgi:hypothetical protein
MSEEQQTTKTQVKERLGKSILDEQVVNKNTAANSALLSQAENLEQSFNQLDKENLKNEVLREIEKESFKKEIIKEIQEANPKFSFSKFAQHPLLLLILGFIFTGIISAWLTSVWQSNEWNRQQTIQSSEWDKQQLRLLQISEINQKYGIIDEATKSVVEHDFAATDILTTFTWKSDDKRLSEEAPERKKHWQQIGKEWRIASQKLLQKLIIHFKDPRIQRTFETAIEDRKRIDSDIENLRLEFERNKDLAEDEAFKKRTYDSYDATNKATGDLRELFEMMIIDIQTDIKERKP